MTRDPGLVWVFSWKEVRGGQLENGLALFRELAVVPRLLEPPFAEEDWMWSNLPLLVVPMEDKPVTPRSFWESLIFRVFHSFELWLSKLLFFKGGEYLWHRHTPWSCHWWASKWIRKLVRALTHASAVPLLCTWHSSLSQYSAARGNGANLLHLLLGLVPHPQKARARTDQTNGCQCLLVEQHLPWGSWGPEGPGLP